MIILKNIQTKFKDKNNTYFHTTVFKENSKLVSTILDIITYTSSSEYSNKITKVYCNIFNKEYKEFFFEHSLDNIYLSTHEKFCSASIDVLDIHVPEVYKNLLDKLISLDIDYDQTVLQTNEDYLYSKIA